MSALSLSGKTIVVTGAASGIGAETARFVRAQGARILAVDRNEPSAEVDAFHRADLSDGAAIERLIRALPDGIDGLANIADPDRPRKWWRSTSSGSSG